MRFGPRTVVERMSHRLLARWVPKWHEAFYDPLRDNFHERLARAFLPAPAGYRRLLTQCRQLALYSHASLQKGTLGFRPDLKKHFTSLCRKFRVEETGGWVFSVKDEGGVHDGTYDLYASAFVIFALCHYARATKDEAARSLARATLDFIDKKFRLPNTPGLAEALDEKLRPVSRPRRQDPHMHLLEACLFAEELWGDPAYAAMADEIVELFFSHFYDEKENILCEWFGADLKPDPEKGRRCQPGHYFEWVWLLKKHAALRGDPARHDAVCRRLLDFGNEHGWDKGYGGIYDEVAPDGTILTDTKRIWPFTEALKANALMLESYAQERPAIKKRIAAMAEVFERYYMRERGFWTERLSRDLSPATDTMPGTTPYHVYFGIMETRDALRTRGRGRVQSLIPFLHGHAYRLRRRASLLFSRLRRIFHAA